MEPVSTFFLAVQSFNKNYSFCEPENFLFTNHTVTTIKIFTCEQQEMSSLIQFKNFHKREKICISMTVLLNFVNQRHFECPLMTYDIVEYVPT